MDACSSVNLNQGLADCIKKFGAPYYFIAAPDDAIIPATAMRNPFSYIREKTMETDPRARWYSIPNWIEQVTNNSTEATKGTLARGYSEKLVEGRFIYLFEWPSELFGDRNIYKFDGYRGGGFIINEKNMFWGVRNSDGTMSPYTSKADVDGGGFSGTGGDVNTVRMTIDIGRKSEVINQSMFIQLSNTDRLETLRGFRDLEILVLPATAANITTVQLVTAGDNMNVFDRFTTAFSQAANWRVDGSAPTAVAADAVNKAFKITTRAGTHEINTAPVDVLKTANVIGFEGIPVVVTVI